MQNAIKCLWFVALRSCQFPFSQPTAAAAAANKNIADKENLCVDSTHHIQNYQQY